MRPHGKSFLCQRLVRASSPGLMLNASSEVDLAIRLHEFGLLPEEQRQAFVSKVVAYAFDGEDLYAIDNAGIQGVFTEAELAEFRRRLRDEMLPKLSDIRYDWQGNYDSDRLPDDHIQPLIDSFEALKKEFADEPAVVSEIDKQIKYAEEWIAETSAEKNPPQERPALAFGDVDGQDQPPAQARSIFDDIDE
jgi:hypothetical protein